MPAGVASQKTGPVAGDIARFARQHTKVARKEPRIQWVNRLDPLLDPGVQRRGVCLRAPLPGISLF